MYVSMYVSMYVCRPTAVDEQLSDILVSEVEAVVQGCVTAVVALVQVRPEPLNKSLAHLRSS